MFNKQVWIIANFKANKNLKATLEWVDLVGPKIYRESQVNVVVCPDFVALEEVKKAIQVGNYPLLLGAQDLSPFPPGAYTGEEPAQDLKTLIDLVIIGHSERRKNFGETDAQVREKVDQANKAGIKALVCVQSVDTPVPEGCQLVAFEPVFAIGTGQPDNPGDAERVAEQLRSKYGEKLEVLYGGSVTSANSQEFLRQSNISGLLIGTASLEAKEFLAILEQLN